MLACANPADPRTDSWLYIIMCSRKKKKRTWTISCRGTLSLVDVSCSLPHQRDRQEVITSGLPVLTSSCPLITGLWGVRESAAHKLVWVFLCMHPCVCGCDGKCQCWPMVLVRGEQQASSPSTVVGDWVTMWTCTWNNTSGSYINSYTWHVQWGAKSATRKSWPDFVFLDLRVL